MWQIENGTPFAADRAWVRDRDGSEVWVVAVKATFDIDAQGELEPSRDQPPVLRMPEHYGDPASTSIKYDADLVLRKSTTDIIVLGSARAPQGTGVTQIDVGFRVGPVSKVLRVFGERRWGRLGLSSPQPFTEVPIVYERAYGGADLRSPDPQRDWDWRNPVGRGFAMRRSHLEETAAPNVEAADSQLRSWDDRPLPGGFGAIAAHWQPRASYAGTYDEDWKRARQPLLPNDFDERFFQSVPRDQQSPQFLIGGEPVVVSNMTTDGMLRFLLPRLHLGFETHFYDGSSRIHPVRRLNTVVVEPDFPRVSLVWHSALPCHSMVHRLEKTTVTLKVDYSAARASGTQ